MQKSLLPAKGKRHSEVDSSDKGRTKFNTVLSSAFFDGVSFSMFAILFV